MAGDGAAPRLAGCAGTYREHRPLAVLEPHFRCVWSHALPRDDIGPVAVVPDGCVDLLWLDGRLVVAGPDRSAAQTPLTPGATVTGIRFRPGAAANWLGLPMSEIVDRRVDLDDLWGGTARDLAAWIGDAESPADRLRRLQSGLGRLAGAFDPPAPELALLFDSLGQGQDGPDLAALRSRLDIAERSLRRRCHDAFGYGPKTLDRIRRFQRFLALARGRREERLAGLAYAAGYADQAHLTREVGRLSGLTPSAILGQLAA